MKVILITLFLFPFLNGFTQDRKAIKYSKTITLEDLKQHLNILASDDFEGRGTGEPGQKKAARYIANNFEASGLTPPVPTNSGPSYYQEFKLFKSRYNTAYLKKGVERKENLQDFLYYSRDETMGEEYIEIVYCGEIEDFDLRGLNVKDKFIAFSADEMTGWRSKLKDLERSQASGYVVIVGNENQYKFALSRFGSAMVTPKIEFSLPDRGTQTIIANKQLAEWIFDKDLGRIKKGKVAKLIFNADMLIEKIESENVIGFIEGTEKPDEVIVVSAHYDHMGIINGKIYNGADDNASGTSAIMEMAEAFAIAAENGDAPKRSILFIAFSGEEEGLLGSKYYVEKPVRPIDNTIVNLNIDMIGRQDLKYSENPDYVYIIGSDRISKDLHQLSEETNNKYSNLRLDYTYNDLNDPNRYFERSDHYSFAQENIPIIFYFNGTHGDYHQHTDTVDKINFQKIKKIKDLIFFTTWEIANREEKIQLN